MTHPLFDYITPLPPILYQGTLQGEELFFEGERALLEPFQGRGGCVARLVVRTDGQETCSLLTNKPYPLSVFHDRWRRGYAQENLDILGAAIGIAFLRSNEIRDLSIWGMKDTSWVHLNLYHNPLKRSDPSTYRLKDIHLGHLEEPIGRAGSLLSSMILPSRGRGRMMDCLRLDCFQRSVHSAHDEIISYTERQVFIDMARRCFSL